MSRYFASAIGAFIGAALTLQFHGSFLSTATSLLTGGLCGWISADVRGFLKGFGRAIKEVALTSIDPFLMGLRLTAELALPSILSAASITAWFVVTLAIPLSATPSLTEIFNMLHRPGFWLADGILGTLAGTWYAIIEVSQLEADPLITREKIRGTWKMFFLGANPIALPFFTLYQIGRGVVGIVRLLSEMVRGICGLLVLGFAYTHTERRKHCFVNAVFGGAVGAFFRQPLLGSLVGGVLAQVYHPYTRNLAEKILAESARRDSEAEAGALN